jgi:ubiquinone/menaquinone biosynthesis C-methylase UbiE
MEWLLDQIPIRAGWRTADIGCGPIGILDQLSERVGPQGLVVGLEREARFFAMACAEAKRRGLGNVRIVAGDALNPDLQEGPFDFAHERLVLMYMPQAQQRTMVSQMLALLKPGGSIALQDYDRVLRVLPRTSILGDFVQNPTPTPSVPAGQRLDGCCRGYCARLAPATSKPRSMRALSMLATAGAPISSVCWL